MNKSEWINLLRSDVQAFNAAHTIYRWENPGERLNPSSANLASANLSSADLSGANLYCANLYRADLPSANGIIRIDGHDSRGFELILVAWEDGPRVKAGCHWFTMPEALAHWGGDDYPDRERGQRYVDAINLAAGWLNSEKEKPE